MSVINTVINNAKRPTYFAKFTSLSANRCLMTNCISHPTERLNSNNNNKKKKKKKKEEEEK
jgi:hypothetical protein